MKTAQTKLRLISRWTALKIALALVLCSSALAHAQERKILSIGVFPYLSTRVMLQTYEPMREYLATRLNRPVHIYTAANYRAFYQKAVRGDFDIALYPPHLAFLAQREAGSVPIARFSRVMHGVFATTTRSPITALEQMRGMELATPDSLALVTILGLEQLVDLGMLPSRDYVWRHGVSHNSALLQLQRGSVQVALVANSALDQMPPEQRENIRVLGRTEDFPALVIMVRPNLPATTRETVRQALLDWHKTPDGARAIEALKFFDIVSVHPNELDSFRIYTSATRDALNAPALVAPH